MSLNIIKYRQIFQRSSPIITIYELQCVRIFQDQVAHMNYARSLCCENMKKVLTKLKNVTCYNQIIVAIVEVLTSFIFIFTNDNR
jgi:hypothetical protein